MLLNFVVFFNNYKNSEQANTLLLDEINYYWTKHAITKYTLFIFKL